MKRLQFIFTLISMLLLLFLSGCKSTNIEYTKDNFVATFNKALESKKLEQYLLDEKTVDYNKNIFTVKGSEILININFTKNNEVQSFYLLANNDLDSNDLNTIKTLIKDTFKNKERYKMVDDFNGFFGKGIMFELKK